MRLRREIGGAIVARACERVAAGIRGGLRLSQLSRRAGRRGGDVRLRLMRPRRRGLLLVRERGTLRRRPVIGRDLTLRPGLEPITLERHAAIVLGSDAVITLASAVDHRTGIRIGIKSALAAELTLAQ